MLSTTALFLVAPIALTLAAPSATTTEPAAACLYTTLPSYTAYAADMPNPTLDKSKVQKYLTDFSFACEASINFEAYLLTTSTLNPKPWFGAAEFRNTTGCTPGAFAGNVGFAMKDSNPNGNGNVTCTKYLGGTTTPFQKAAAQYFQSIQ